MTEHKTLEQKKDCSCLQGNFDYHNFQETYLGGSPLRGEVEVFTCKVCDRRWLSIFYEPKIHNDEEGWFRGLIKAEDIASIKEGNVLQNAIAYLKSLDWYYIDGTYWNNLGFKTPFKTHGKVNLWS